MERNQAPKGDWYHTIVWNLNFTGLLGLGRELHLLGMLNTGWRHISVSQPQVDHPVSPTQTRLPAPGWDLRRCISVVERVCSVASRALPDQHTKYKNNLDDI